MKVLRSKNVTTDVTGLKQARAAVVFTPGSLFFTHVTEWPEGLGGQDLAAFVALTLEEVSPFALDSLAWGFCCDAASRSLFLYAACLPRINVSEQEQWPLADHVYPAFLPLLVKREHGVQVAQEARWELVLTEREVLLLEYAAASRWPHRLHAAAFAVAADAPAQSALAAAEHLLVKASLAKDVRTARSLLSACADGATAVPTASGAVASAASAGGRSPVINLSLWQVLAAGQSRRGEIYFSLQQWDPVVAAGVKQADAGTVVAGSASAQSVTDGSPAMLRTVLEGEEALWQADLRDEGFIVLARKRRIADLRLWYALCGAAATAALLIVLLLVFAWLGSVLSERTATLAAQNAAVERVRQDQDLLMRMRQFSADPFEPFSLFAALKSIKPAPIYFDSVELSAPDSVTVEGQGPTVDSVNAYARALEQAGGYRAARQARMNLKDGASVFTLYLQYLGQPQQTSGADVATQSAATAAGTQSTSRNVVGGDSNAQGGQGAGLPRTAAGQSDGAMRSGVVSDGTEDTADNGEGAADIFFQPVVIEAMAEHKVSEDESLAQIAERYDLPISMILQVNPDLDPLGMEEGQIVLIPVPAPPPLPLPEN